MKYRNLLVLGIVYGLLFAFLYWLVRDYPGASLNEKLRYLIRLLREDQGVLLKATLVYSVCLSIPYIPGGLGWVIVGVTGLKGVLYFMLGSLLSFGTNFIIGRRFPFIMKIFKREIARRLHRKEWWPQDENVDIFRIIRHYFEEDRVGSKIYSALRRIPIGFRFNEQTIVFLTMLLPVNVIVGGGGGVGLVCGEECTLSFFSFMKIVFLAHIIFAAIPYAAHLLLR